MHRDVALQRAIAASTRVADRDVSLGAIRSRIAGARQLGAAEDVLRDVLLVRHAGDFFDDGAEGDVAAVAVLIALAGREGGWAAADEAEVIRVRREAGLRRRAEFGPEEIRDAA